MRMAYVALALCVACALGAALAFSMFKGPSEVRILAAGSTSVKPLMDLWADRYMQEHASYRIDVQGGGSGKGIQNVANKVVDIGMHSRPILPGDPKFDNVTLVVANDGVLVVVNRECPIVGLTRRALQAVFNYPPQDGAVETFAWVLDGGEVREVPVRVERSPDGTVTLRGVGGGFTYTLQPYVRSESSGTAEVFAVFLYGSWEAKWSGPQGKGVTGNQGMASAVESDAHGIGYIAKAYFNPERMRAVVILYDAGERALVWNGYAYDEATGLPSDEAIMKGAAGKALVRPAGSVLGGYPLSRELYVSLNLDKYGGRIPRELADFLRWCLTEGQELVGNVHYIRLGDDQRSRCLQLIDQYASG